MAYVRAHETKQKRNGKPIKTYAVIWREAVRDDFGLPTGQLRARRETDSTREAAEARRDELNAARHTTGTTALAEQRKAGELPFGYYARGWRDAQAFRGVRLHDLRHTFAVLQLSAGTHVMQVSKWLGHSTFTLTLDTYGDYIPEQDGGAANTLPEPPLPTSEATVGTNVVSLRAQAG